MSTRKDWSTLPEQHVGFQGPAWPMHRDLVRHILLLSSSFDRASKVVKAVGYTDRANLESVQQAHEENNTPAAQPCQRRVFLDCFRQLLSRNRENYLHDQDIRRYETDDRDTPKLPLESMEPRSCNWDKSWKERNRYLDQQYVAETARSAGLVGHHRTLVHLEQSYIAQEDNAACQQHSIQA